MKKIMFSFAVIAISMSAKSQIRIGVQASASVNSPTVSGLSTSIKEKITTVSPGLVFDIPVTPGFNFRPSLNYLTLNGTIAQANILPGINSNTQTISQNLQIPLDLTFPIKAGKNSKILLMAGPVITIGLDGTINRTTVNAGSGITVTNTSNPLIFGNGSAQVKKVDWGSRFGLGYRYKKLDLTAQYKFGFTDANNDPNITSKQHIVSLTASWFLFGSK